MKKIKNTTKHRSRRERTKNLLMEQLKRGTKPEKVNGRTTDNIIALTDSDRNRINRELEKLNNQKK